MKATEAAALLTICAAYDNRKPDADQAKAWALVLDGYRFEDCRDAIVAHYRTSREWIMPADVIAGVKRIRNKRVTDFGPLPDHPASVNPDSAEQYGRWLRETTEAIADGTYRREDIAPAAVETNRDVIRELGQAGQDVDLGPAMRRLRAERQAARIRQQEADADRKQAEDEKRARIEAMRTADREARQSRAHPETPDPTTAEPKEGAA